jgi:hypothetical protein
MAEILVSDFCECRPLLLIGGLFHCPRAFATVPNRRISVGGDSRAAPSLARIFRPFRLFCALFFHCYFHCFPLFLRRRIF